MERPSAVIFDEFHERSLDADASLALAKDAKSALRPDLRLIVMSATLGDVGERVARLLGAGEEDEESKSSGGCPVITSEGKSFPVETKYLGPPGKNFMDLENAMITAVRKALTENPGPDGGDILCFLPGAGEINRVVRDLRDGGGGEKLSVMPLYGGLSQSEQSDALAPAPPGVRRVVVATPIAESSLTIPGVRIVIDSGLRRAPRFDANKGTTRLDVVKISLASADQRRGRAGRVAPGTCYRLWSELSHASLAPDTPPEITSADLAPLALDLAAWGVDDPASLPWLDPPPAGQMAAARTLLTRLGAIDAASGRVTREGARMARLPLHPRHARMALFAARRGPESARLACQLAATLGDRDVLRGRDVPVDVRSRVGALWSANGGGGWASPAGAGETTPTGRGGRTPPATAGIEPAAGPVRVPIGTKLPSGRKKGLKGAPKGRKPAGGGVQAAAKAARAAKAAGGTAGGGGGGASGSGDAFHGHVGHEIDRAAATEAGKVATQLLDTLKRIARDGRDDAEPWCAPGVGDGDPVGPVFSFLLGERDDEAGVLLALAYPDRVGVRRSKGGAFALSNGKGAASVPSSDVMSREDVIAIAELGGGGGGDAAARNDRARLAAPVPLAALLPASGDAPAGCLHDALCETRDVVAWAAASKAIVARRQLRVGEAVIRETAFAPAPEAVVDAMLQGVRAIGVKNALGWSEKTEQWRRRVMWSRDSGDDALPDLSDAALEASLEEWLAPMLPGVTSVSALRKLDGDGLLRCMVDYESSRRVEASCPTHVVVPSGSKLPVDYGAPGGTPVLRARLQELFGMTETPRAGANKTVAMEVHLLSPAGRPVQVTTDLKSFWANAYHDVAKEMRGRYPKHYWPEDPTTAEATNRAKPRKTK